MSIEAISQGHTEQVVEEVRAALMDAATRAYEDARISGLCSEGAWELAVEALRDEDLSSFKS